MRLILDPSVVIKWYVPEQGWQAAWELKAWLQVGPQHILVPDLFIAEISNVVWKKSVLLKQLPQKTASIILKEVLSLPFQVLPTAGLIQDAYQMAQRFRVAVYDAIYLAAAVQHECLFVTADEALSRRMETYPLSRQVVLLPAWKEKLRPEE